MSTQLGTYCQQFDATLRPVLEPFDRALQAIDAAVAATPGKGLRSPLADTRHHLLALCDKVSEQQAYVLIFGPLKSGKSTLMNAIAAAYVSEVSSLPAYPCLVFVSAGKQREYVVTTYEGKKRTFTNARELHDHIDGAHRELARAIRQAEERGASFDPQEHFPAAIRRVDVRVPDSQLEATGAVLVDTPGLYTRMRFGYDRMTRDFRNAAACAIFVVKSDTLFLEQVFAEFQQLLDLFSRIFLVVNVDSQKRDVSPDGKLVPSLEQSQPEAVLRAFEHLAMSAPLQKAASEGRVRMYPVDLLHAASGVLRKAPADQVPASFRAFQTDLANYLASSEYMAAFLRDSLQRGRGLLDETGAAANGPEVVRLRSRIVELDEQIRFLDREQQRVQEAVKRDWSAAFARCQKETDAEIERSARDAGAKLLRTLGASIDTWFLSSHSLEWLVQGQWNPLVRDYRDDVLAAGRRVFDTQLGQTDAGLELDDDTASLFHRAGIDARIVRARGLAALGALQWPTAAAVPVDVAAIPIKKGVLDVVAFRSLDRVRERLLGPANKPDVKIPGKEKAARLGEPGRLHLHQCVTQYRGELAPQTVAVLRRFFGADLAAATGKAVVAELEAYAPRLAEKRATLQQERDRLAAVATPIAALAAATLDVKAKLESLGRGFDLAVGTQAPAKDPVLEPQPRREPPARDERSAKTRDGRRVEKTG
ncbi:MAG: dynamin family protein [Planctomycetes bacterium]|nr:dynamin family protein [Planctomycetota bacterium]